MTQKFEIKRREAGDTFLLSATLKDERKRRTPISVCFITIKSFDVLTEEDKASISNLDGVLTIFWNREISIHVHTTTLYEEIMRYIEGLDELKKMKRVLLKQFFFDYLHEKEISLEDLHVIGRISS